MEGSALAGYRELSPDELRYDCDQSCLPFQTTEELPPLDEIIGQERAMRAVQFGLAMRNPGYNIFVTGPTGTGRSTYVQQAAKKFAENRPIPDDWCYVYNFHEPDVPLALRLPAGVGEQFREDMRDLVEDLKQVIPRAFESDEYEKQKTSILQEIHSMIEETLLTLHKRAEQEGFTLNQTPAGIVTIPLKEDGSPLTQEEFQTLPQEARQAIQEKNRRLQAQMNESVRRIRELEREGTLRIKQLDREVISYSIGPHLDRIQEKYKDYPVVASYLDSLREDLPRNLGQIRAEISRASGDEAVDASRETGDRAAQPGSSPEMSYLRRLTVNLFVNNSETRGAPVIYETNPTYYNLFGKIEYKGQMGTFFTDFTMIRSGAIHRANGGILILQARDLLFDPLAWDTLKRTLKNGEARVENIGEQFRIIPTVTLKPQPIPVDVKVILIGTPYLYQLLYHLDEDFRKYFKVKADFDDEMDRTPEHMNKYAQFIASVCKRQNLRPFDRSGVARVIEYSSRLLEKQDKLSTRFNDVVEIIYEANALAEADSAPIVTASHVDRAIEEKIYRSNKVEEKIRELIEKGIIYIETEGAVVGQVNGLSILDVGDYVFGRPSRITARTYVGDSGVVHIEREVKMSGRIHDKGALTLTGYLGSKYAQERPLSLSASICFEQLYEGVEGDSASSTELYALLSSLSGVPIKQGVAVTGSVDQLGRVQAIGGVNEKIEGFFMVCKAKGLTGEQGVLIPEDNVKDLMLKPEVVEAVRDGKFHIYSVKTIDDGIEVLTGMPAGQLQRDGNYPEGTINYLVRKRLDEFAEKIKEYHDS